MRPQHLGVHDRKEATMFGPRGTALAIALQHEYIRKVNSALEHGDDREAIVLAGRFAEELGLIRVA